MRLCALRAALAATPDANNWVLHEPRAWLGTAFHKLIEAMRSGATTADSERIWNAAIAEAVAAARGHALDRRYLAPERWPSYYLVRQRAFALAGKVSASRRPEELHARAAQLREETRRSPERRFEARDGRLVGRPDYYDGHTLTEYKSSLPDVAWAGAAEIMDGFRRQVRLYAVIIAEVFGKWPTNGRVIAASGQVIEVNIDPIACNAEANAALAALDALNSALTNEKTAEDLANPSASACSSCPFQILCPAFWRHLGLPEMNDLTDAALEGVLERLESGPDGDLYTAYITAQSTSGHLNSQQAVVLRASVHGELAPSNVGSSCRLVGGRARPDGRLGADLSTIVFAVPNLPRLETALETAASSIGAAI
jgi:hypothetical protein